MVSPRAQRVAPLYQQITDHYTELIRSGQLVPGDPFPPIRDIARDWGVGFQTAQHAVELMTSAKLLLTSPAGTAVAPRRAAYGPAELIHGEQGDIIMRAADLLVTSGPAAYVRPILGLAAAIPPPQVVRREWQALDPDGSAWALCVSWTSAAWLDQVPELLHMEPLPPGQAASLIAGRTGRQLAPGEVSHEARPVMDDDREAPALGLGPDGHVLAVVAKWSAADGTVLEYLEMAVREGRVLRYVIEP